MFKMLHHLAPPGLTELLPNTADQRNPYNIRSANEMDIPRARSEAYSRSFIPDTCRKWNNLPQELKDIPSLEEFKERIRPASAPPPNHYYAGTRREQILISRLRTRNPDLKQNLFHRNLSETDICDCNNEQESIEHFMLTCSLYTQQRRKMLLHARTLNVPISAEFLLKGSPNLSQNDNDKILKATLVYINETARFK